MTSFNEDELQNLRRYKTIIEIEEGIKCLQIKMKRRKKRRSRNRKKRKEKKIRIRFIVDFH